MTTAISRRTLAKGAAWSAPVVVAAAAVPAYAASFEQRYGIQYGLFVSTQNNGGFVGYQGSNNTGTILPATPDAYFAASPKPESDINWNDATSRPTGAGYVNGEGSFTPVNNTASGLPGAYGSNSGFWFSAPTNNVATGSDYISRSTATLLKGATFVTDVEYTVPAGSSSNATAGTINTTNAWVPTMKAPITGNLTALNATATYLSTANIAGTWSAAIPTVTTNADGSVTFKGRITYTTTADYRLTQTGTKYYAQTNFMPAVIKFPNTGWISYSQTSFVQSATINYTANGTTTTLPLTGLNVTSRIVP